ncbi:dihydrodipicolinate synthase family protein [Pontibacter sp. SGAir0037]|uniref:dihydrodipicolinate synthase family protein n=1 Tax=Pontibacter sp. SGAir0037 TaxID=2571030 RepID=UPI0010CD6999|nr:dihydrodipicolinate synthase family protein [Pontibacter sp. SGAir0037]QCR22292.1 dihydrodipicolinate synthase family protein [Pontibacter sp. SGAir0037]
MSVKWEGVFPAVTTKFTAEDELDIPAFVANLEAQLAAGVDGIILGGTLGEASTLSDEEKFELVRQTVAFVDGRVPVILNIAEQTTAKAIEVAATAKKNGVSGLMLLPPMRYKADASETVAYFKAIAKSTDLPIMIYNNPIDYRIEVTLDMFEELTACANIQAVKESTRETSRVTEMINRFGDRFKILSGVDTIAFESLVLGADGWVAGLVCAFPAETVAIYRLVKAGRIAEAVAINRWFYPLLQLDVHPKLVQNIKLAELMTGLGTEQVRLPRMPLEGEERERVLGIIENALQKRPVLPEVEVADLV